MRLPLEAVISKYHKSLFGAALGVLADFDEADDAVQETFIRYYNSDLEFNDESHLKAWLLRVVINCFRDVRKSYWKRNRVSLEEISDIPFETEENRSLFKEVMALPDKYRAIIHLFYYEDMSVKDIASVMSLSEDCVKMRLSRGRELLKKSLKGKGYAVIK